MSRNTTDHIIIVGAQRFYPKKSWWLNQPQDGFTNIAWREVGERMRFGGVAPTVRSEQSRQKWDESI